MVANRLGLTGRERFGWGLPIMAALMLCAPAPLGAGPAGDRAWAGAMPLWQATTEAGAKTPTPSQHLAKALRLDRLIDVLSEEGRAQGGDLGADLFDPVSAARWRAAVEAIHQPARMRAIFDAALDGALAGQQPAVEAIAAYFAQPEQGRILDLELDARQALVDPALSDAAALAWQRIDAADAPRAAALRRFVQVNDLIEANVAGGMNANLAFLRGMAETTEAGAPGLGPQDEAGLLADIWSQEEVIRAETEDWLMPYLALAYRPLGTEAVDAYSDFCASAPGQALNRALLAAYDALFVAISADLGRAAGRMMAGSDL